MWLCYEDCSALSLTVASKPAFRDPTNTALPIDWFCFQEEEAPQRFPSPESVKTISESLKRAARKLLQELKV